MGARTIDEGSLDEKSGMNFSEYVAILSGNTDLLEKARLERKVAALESERKAFGRNKTQSEYKLKIITDTINGNNEKAVRMKRDLELFNSRVRYDREGNRLNSVRLDGVNSADVKILAAKLNHFFSGFYPKNFQTTADGFQMTADSFQMTDRNIQTITLQTSVK